MTRMVTFAHEGARGLGVLVEGGVVDLGRRLPEVSTIGGLLDPAVADRLRHAATEAADIPAGDVMFLPPVTSAEKIICVGINYPARTAEYGDGRRDSAYPNLFVRFLDSFVGHRQPLVRPRASEQLDYEGEIVLVMGRPGRHIGRDEALGYVGGVTIGNEGTIRDWVTHGTRNVTQGKNFDGSGSIGPWVVPAAELRLDEPLAIETRVNGVVRQKDSSDRLLWGFAELIGYVSTFTTLRPGDLIFTGTPTGSGSHAKPPVWLVPGDVVEVEVSGVGVLANPVVDEP
jgi:2-keto-4-pentenoate hydratase/2-oxohepta-3-ene-1,7-dioic acid hydratase in catechol pathway